MNIVDSHLIRFIVRKMATESTPGQDLARFCAQLEDYTPTVCFEGILLGAMRFSHFIFTALL